MVYRFREYLPALPNCGHLKMGSTDSRGNRIEANSLYFTKAGLPWIGEMGEYHYCRGEKENWQHELQKMKAGGIGIVSTYVFWNYHEETEGTFDFSRNNDIGAFLSGVIGAGMEICLRLGPWINAECRNGGLPDWLLDKPCQRRTNDPGYLRYVKRFWRKLFDQIKDIPLCMIQIENELIDQPEHIRTLKELALDIGYRAAVFTATGWNSAGGAKLPPG